MNYCSSNLISSPVQNMWTLAFYSQITQVIPELHTPLLCIAVSGLHNTATQPKVIYPMDLEVKGKGFDFYNLLDFNQGRINIARVYAEAYADYPIELLRVNKAYVNI